MNKAELTASNPWCVKNSTGKYSNYKKCPEFIKKYKDCAMNTTTGKP